MENYCENWAALAAFGGGLGCDGGMAEYMLVPFARLLVSMGSLSPAKAAPLRMRLSHPIMPLNARYHHSTVIAQSW